MESIRNLLEEAAEKHGRNTFVYFRDREVSFEEAERRAGAVASGMWTRGLRKGDRAAIMLQNRPEYLDLWFGLNKIGASMVPINTELTAYEAAYVIGHSESIMVVTDSVRYPVVKKALEDCPKVRSLILLDMEEIPPGAESFEELTRAGGGDHQGIEIGAGDEAAVLYTSGTTGRPKGCVVDQFYYLNAGRMYCEELGISNSDRILTPLPLFHMNAQALSAMGALYGGAGLILIDRFHPMTWWPTIREKKATFFHYLGVIPAFLIGFPESPDDGSHPKVYGVGAGVPKDIHARFEERFNVALLELYGSTESGGGACFFNSPSRHADRKVGTGTFGKQMPNMEAIIADDDDREVPHGTVGELLIRSSDPADRSRGMMRGYLKDPQGTAEAWRNGWFHTGDFCVRDEEGYFYFVDRKKDMIRRSGENISASEVEEVIRLHPDVVDTAVIPVPDLKRVEEVKAYIIRKPDSETPPEEIIRWCEERLAYFKIPRYIEFRTDLPRTSTLKVQKKILREERKDLTADCWDRTLHMKLEREKARTEKRS